MKTTEEMIAVMTAFKEGKTIEFCKYDDIDSNEWERADNPTWSWNVCDYRVKKEPQYRPYETLGEVLNNMKIHGPAIKFNSNVFCIPQDINFLDGHPIVHCNVPIYSSVSAAKLLDYTWQDGYPCGVKID